MNGIGESLSECHHGESGPLIDQVRPFVHAHMARRTGVLFDVVDTATWDHSKLAGAR